MSQQIKQYNLLIYSGVLLLVIVLLGAAGMQARAKQSANLIAEGRQIFRYDTFGDEDFWGGQLRLHEAIEGEEFGGVGPGVSPATALAVGLKVDVQALPKSQQNDLKKGKVDLDDTAVTLALLKLNAIVGVTGFFNEDGRLRSMGIQCAFCHSTVDDSFAPGIGGFGGIDLTAPPLCPIRPNGSLFASGSS